MKKLTTVILGFVISVHLLGCGGSSSGGGDETTDPIDPVDGIEFECQFQLVTDESRLIQQGRDAAAKGMKLEDLLKHASNCRS